MFTEKDQRILNLITYLADLYNKGTPKVSDQLYDKLVNLSPLKKYLYWEPKGDVELPINLGSVKSVTLSEIPNLISSGEITVEPKVDGVNLTVFRKGNTLVFTTRGDGTYGKNVSIHLKHLVNLFHELKKGSWVNGEAYIDKSTYKKFDKGYTSPRNMVSSLLNRKEPSELDKHIKMVRFLQHFDKNLVNIPRISCNLNLLNKLPNSLPVEWRNLPMDGVVIILPSESYVISKQGYRVDRLAIKFSSEETVTRITSIHWQMGITGTISPVASVQPVNLNGQVISKVTLHNLEWCSSKGIGEGAKVMVHRAGLIIPAVKKVLSEGSKLNLIDYCPWCRTRLVTRMKPECLNLACPEKFKQAIRWATSSKMFGTKEGYVQVKKKLSGSIGVITMLIDSLRLWPKDSLLFQAIPNKLPIRLDQKKLMLITLLGVRGFSVKTASRLENLSGSARLTWLLNESNLTVKQSLLNLSKLRWLYLIKLMSITC